MRLPIRRTQGSSLLGLPDLSGGLNMRDGISEVLDNQLTECKNMWWKDGVLCTRYGMYENKMQTATGCSEQDIIPNLRLHNVYKSQFGVKTRLSSVYTFLGTTGYITFYWLSGTGAEEFSQLKFSENTPNNYFVIRSDNKLYCFTDNKEIHTCELEDKAYWQKVEATDYYIPLVMTACRTNAKVYATKDEVMSGGVMVEGFNIINDYYKMSFNSYNMDVVTKDNPSHKMIYHIIQSVSNTKYDGKIVTAVYRKNGVEYTHKVTLNSASGGEERDKLGDGLIMRVKGNSVSFLSDAANNTYATVSDGDEGDLVITAPYIADDKEKEKVFGMSRTEWYGGGAAGIAGGTRLFLCGNTNHPDLVMWSGLNNPLYFPENCYFYVGNDSGAVTGFGKQGENLVIFKENETWLTQYVQNTNITSDNIMGQMGQNIIDFTASSVYFPLIQVNPYIGCAHPESVQLCRNRLIWLGADNKIYTLVSESPYNEHSIYCVSEMVDRKIKELNQQSTLRQVTACDWEGYYCILLNGTLLLMDYNCYGYTHIASYSKTEDANVKIPWFLWELPKGDNILAIGDKLCSFMCESFTPSITDGDSCLEEGAKGSGFNIRSFSFENYSADLLYEGDKRVETEIESSFTTKIFAFGAPHIRKNIEQVNLQVGNNGGNMIKVFFITENGTNETDITPKGRDTINYTAGYIDSCAVFPSIKQVLRFGIKLESKGTLAVDSAVIKYRITGGAR